MIKRVLRHLPYQTTCKRIFIHAYKRFLYPQVASIVVPDIQPTTRDVVIARRLLDAYHRALSSFPVPRQAKNNDIWTDIRKSQVCFLDLLHRNDPNELAAYLCNMSRHDATIGTVQGNYEYRRIRINPFYRRFIAAMTKDKLVALAEAVGALSCENPEQGSWGENIYLDSNMLVEKISTAIGIDITPPAIDGGLFKISASAGLFGERDLNAIYTAYIIHSILTDRRMEKPRICEIGAGTGRVAYWCNRLGHPSYTIIDLPHINVIQGYYLLKTLPENSVVLYGECIPKEFTEDCIEILPTFAIEGIDANKYTIAVNQDSFPEIDRETVMTYLKWIQNVSKGYFLSINHESKPPYGKNQCHISVPELVKETGGFRRILRVPYWLRKGYVAEVYRIIK